MNELNEIPMYLWADPTGNHTATCCGIHQFQHDEIVGGTLGEVKRAGIVAEKEPRHLVQKDGRRPDILMYHYQGRNTCLDITVVNAFSGPNCQQSGASIKTAEKRKQDKYATDLAKEGYDFLPFAMDTTGAFGESAMEIMRVLGRNTRNLTEWCGEMVRNGAK